MKYGLVEPRRLRTSCHASRIAIYPPEPKILSEQLLLGGIAKIAIRAPREPESDTPVFTPRCPKHSLHRDAEHCCILQPRTPLIHRGCHQIVDRSVLIPSFDFKGEPPVWTSMNQEAKRSYSNPGDVVRRVGWKSDVGIFEDIEVKTRALPKLQMAVFAENNPGELPGEFVTNLLA